MRMFDGMRATFRGPLGLLLLFSLTWTSCSPGPEARGATRGPPNGERVTPIAAAPVERRDLARTVTVTGPVEPVRTIGVNSQASGTILSVGAIEGDRVEAGHVLAQLDASEPQAQLERAQAVLASAEGAYQRAQTLHRSQIITDAELEQARSAHGVALSDVRLWQTRLGFARVRAPVAGVVTAKFIEAGSAVSPNQRLFELADVSLLVVRVRVSELDVVDLRPGEAVDLTLDAYPDAAVTGVIRRIFPSADPESRLLPVEVALGRRPAGVDARPGFLARVTFAVDRRRQVLTVPAPAVGVIDDAAFVFVVDADTLSRRPVFLGVTSEGWVEVTRGLSEGDLVVTSGHTNLRSGMQVRVTPVVSE